MKVLLVVTSFFLCTITLAQNYNWHGTYTYIVKSSPDYIQGDESLTIKPSKRLGYNFEWTIEAIGIQMYYVISGYAINKGSYVDFFFEKKQDGSYIPEERIFKNKPFFKMQYSNNKVLTKWVQPESQKAFHPYFIPD